MTIKRKVKANALNHLEKLTGGKLTLAKLLWAIRTGDEISQVEFAATLGISRQQLCDIEHDRKSVSPKLAAKYAKILGYSTSQFIRLALQSIVDKDGLNVQVDIKIIARKKKISQSKAA